MADNLARLSELELQNATMQAQLDDLCRWKRSQVVRNWARAITYVVLLLVSTSTVITLVILNNYLGDRREVSERRAEQTDYRISRDEYAFCQDLDQRKARSSDPDSAWVIGRCETVLAGPTFPAPPDN